MKLGDKSLITIHKTMKKEEIKEVRKLRKLFPGKLTVSVGRSEDGTFLARINIASGLFTEGSNFSELIEMVNDAVKTYYEIPEKFTPFMPNYVPPLEVAKDLDIFPTKKGEKKIELAISIRESVAC